MSHIRKTLSLALCAAAATLACNAASAKDDASACPSISNVQRRIVEHADQGMDALRGYVWGTGIVYGIRMEDVKTSIDDWREAVACQERVARAASQVDVASKAPEADH